MSIYCSRSAWLYHPCLLLPFYGIFHLWTPEYSDLLIDGATKSLPADAYRVLKSWHGKAFHIICIDHLWFLFTMGH